MTNQHDNQSLTNQRDDHSLTNHHGAQEKESDVLAGMVSSLVLDLTRKVAGNTLLHFSSEHSLT